MNNTSIAICEEEGNVYVDFKGSEYAPPAYLKIKNNSEIIATYNRKAETGGFFEVGMNLGNDVRRAVNQKRISRTNNCSVKHENHASAMDVIKSLTGVDYPGSLPENATFLEEIY